MNLDKNKILTTISQKKDNILAFFRSLSKKQKIAATIIACILLLVFGIVALSSDDSAKFELGGVRFGMTRDEAISAIKKQNTNFEIVNFKKKEELKNQLFYERLSIPTARSDDHKSLLA
jgi:hypothetical protein